MPPPASLSPGSSPAWTAAVHVSSTLAQASRNQTMCPQTSPSLPSTPACHPCTRTLSRNFPRPLLSGECPNKLALKSHRQLQRARVGLRAMSHSKDLVLNYSTHLQPSGRLPTARQARPLSQLQRPLGREMLSWSRLPNPWLRGLRIVWNRTVCRQAVDCPLPATLHNSS